MPPQMKVSLRATVIIRKLVSHGTPINFYIVIFTQTQKALKFSEVLEAIWLYSLDMHALTKTYSYLTFTFPCELIQSFQGWVKDQKKKQVV